MDWRTIIFVAALSMPVSSLGDEFDPIGPTTATNILPPEAEIVMPRPPPPSFAGAVAPSPATMMVNSNFQALDNGAAFPPDTMGAVNGTYAMTMLNSEVLIQYREPQGGSRFFSKVSLSNWWGAVGPFNFIFDPRLLYDPYDERWVAAAATREPYSIVVAVSETGNPTGAWYRHQFLVPETNLWADRPNLGFNRHWVAVQMNMHRRTDDAFQISRFYIFNRTNLYAGGTNHKVIDWTFGNSHVPALTYDTNINSLYLLCIGHANTTNSQGVPIGSLAMQQISGPVTNPVITLSARNPSMTRPWKHRSFDDNFARQSNSTVKIHTGDGRMQSVVYKNGSLWAAHTVYYPTNEFSEATHSAVQWWQIATNGIAEQVGQIGGSNFNMYSYPSIAVNRFNDVLIGYNRFSSNQFVSANFAYRNFWDETHKITHDTVFKEGEGVYHRTESPTGQGRNRWGDYSMTMVDPINDIDFWTIQEYPRTPVGTNAVSGRWATWWAQIKVQLSGNDAFASATALSGSSGSVTTNNYRATKETDEPNHAGNGGGKSVWFSWTAPQGGWVVFDTVDSQFDTLIGVYTGSSVSTLTVVTNDNDSGPDLTSRVIFNATSNETYRIAVDGVNGKSGTLVLHWTQSLAPLIVVEPETTNVVANVNENGVFRVTAVGNPLPTYQWRHEGTSITGATNWTHTITNVQVSDAGGYTVVCTNISGSVTSAVASLIVHGDSAARLSLFGLSSNQFRFHIYGLTNRAYRVESSTNLAAPITWRSEATNIVSFWHTNVVQTNFPVRFFRVITNSL